MLIHRKAADFAFSDPDIFSEICEFVHTNLWSFKRLWNSAKVL